MSKENIQDQDDSQAKDDSQQDENLQNDSQSNNAKAKNDSQKQDSGYEQMIERLKGIISDRDKKLNELSEQKMTVEERIAKLEQKTAVQQRLATEQLPEIVKKSLLSKIDTLTEDAYESEKQTLMSIYTQAKEERKKDTVNVMQDQDDAEKSKSFEQALASATTPEEIMELTKKFGL